jgi:membrane-bound serine protease (ClpP class)
MFKLRNFKMREICLGLVLGTSFLHSNAIFSEVLPKAKPKKILILEMRESIAPPMWYRTKKALEQAKNANADIILIHMNTYGGMLESADSIRTAILQSKIPVWVFIDNNAASAGALIAIACDSIYMRKGANIGAATVVNQSGEKMPDKYQSYMRALMRSTAESNNRNPLIAQAMVDPALVIPGVADSGKVLTLTANEALKYGFCNNIAANVEEVLLITRMNNSQIIYQDLGFVGWLIGFLVNPAVSGILIIIIIAGIYFEFQSPGAIFPIILAGIAASLYFAPLYMEGLAAHWEIILFFLGVLLVAVEIFAIPGFGLIGISGVAIIILGLLLSLLSNRGFDFSNVGYLMIIKALLIVVISFFLSILSSILISKKIFTTNVFGELALNSIEKKELGFNSENARFKVQVGRVGVASTNLRPAGKIEIENDIFNALAENGFIEKGETILVSRYENSNLIVKKVE